MAIDSTHTAVPKITVSKSLAKDLKENGKIGLKPSDLVQKLT